jgi:hypothetical protein
MTHPPTTSEAAYLASMRSPNGTSLGNIQSMRKLGKFHWLLSTSNAENLICHLSSTIDTGTAASGVAIRVVSIFYPTANHPSFVMFIPV